MSYSRRPPARSPYPDFGTLIWNSPERNVRQTCQFDWSSHGGVGQYCEIFGFIHHRLGIHTVRLRTLQSDAELCDILSRKRRRLWLRARVELTVIVTEAGDSFHPMTGFVSDIEPPAD